MRLPFPGENVYLLCKKCNHSFSGPCPNYGMPNILNLLFSYNPWWQTGTIQKEFNKPMKRFAYYDAMEKLNHSIRVIHYIGRYSESP